MDEDNKPYITVVELYGVYHVNKMEYDSRADDYQVGESRQCHTRIDAIVNGADWAKSEGLEFRI